MGHVPLQSSADHLERTPSGATFTVPKGWWLDRDGDLVALREPDREMSIFLVDLEAPDAVAAVQTGWRRVDPGFARAVRRVDRPPAKDGWEEVADVIFDIPDVERRSITGLARRRAKRWYVFLLDGKWDALGRRGAQRRLVLQTYRAAGVGPESFSGRSARPLTPDRLAALDAFARDALARSQVPGAAVAVVQGGRVVFEKGYGVKELGSPDRVDPKTLFLIGSMTKPLTTLLMARLVDERRFDWRTKVTDVLPQFRLGDPSLTAATELWHTACACTGMPRQDMEMVFHYGGVTPEQRLATLATMKPTTGFAETFQYSNLMVMAGGYAAGHAFDAGAPLGRAYDEAMQKEVFDPLGMSSTTFDFARAARADHASPHHMDIQGRFHALPLSDEGWLPAIRPAGGAWSNVEDMARYIAMELSGGTTPAGVRFVSESALLRRRQPSVRSGENSSYGLGLAIDTSLGVKAILHDGGTSGFGSLMAFWPDQGLGLVVLTNASGGGPVVGGLFRKLLELCFDGRNEADPNVTYALAQREAWLLEDRERLIDAPDPGWLQSLAHSYVNPALGTLTISVVGSQLLVDAGDWKSVAGEYREKEGVPKLVLLDAPHAGMEFLPSHQDGATVLTLDVGQQRYEFRATAPSP